MSTAQPFTISIPDSEIQRLQQKLELSRFPDELDGAEWEYGAPLADVKRLAAYWKDTFDWRKAEEKLNELPQYTTTIEVDGFDPIDVHFIHHKSEVKNAIPLLFVHGWPGGFFEVAKILPILAESHKNGGPAFHVVAPSLPNFGFSGGVKKKGFGQQHYAETCHKLMLSLGYDQYVSQGGDWGSMITRIMAHLYGPTHHKAVHLNFMTSLPPTLGSPFAFAKFLITHLLNWYTPEEKAGLKRSDWFRKSGKGYFDVQSTKPQTLGYSLADSPVGLLAWIYEKLHDWTDNYPWTDDEICTWISIYWFSKAGPAASVRIYYESSHGSFPAFETANKYIQGVKLGMSFFPGEIMNFPRAWAAKQGEIVYKNEHERGGHFAAFEHPEALAGDVRIMFGKGGGAFGVVEGKDGY